MKQLLPAFLAGILTTLAFDPAGLWWLAPVTLALLFFLLLDSTPGRAFLTGWLFGAGLLCTGIFWIENSMSVYAGMPRALAITLAMLLALGLALYYGLAAWLAVRLTSEKRKSARLIALAVLLVVMEWIRGWFLTGFPWLTIGYTQIDSWLAGYAPIGGVLLVSLLITLTASALAGLIKARSLPAIILALAVIPVWGAGYLLQGRAWTSPDGPARTVSLLQGNIPQDQKWLPEMLLPTLDFYIGNSMEHLDSDLILWPESAIPSLARNVREDVIEPLRRTLGEQQKVLVTGVLTNPEPDVYFNTLLSLDGGEQLYHKRHLVPFGEYFPLAWLWKESLSGLATMGDDFTASRAPKPLLKIGDLTAGASICYEIIFGEEIRDAVPEAQVLINMSNDGWFGTTWGPLQHFQMARMRALESGRYLLRSTNTGITAVIDAHGRVTARLPQFERGVLTASFTPYQGLTPYARFGLLPWAALSVILLLIAFLADRGRRVSLTTVH
ncbi:MAG: apolipoprotein N-acyltransferase [Gammaproteobacteria bacterium]